MALAVEANNQVLAVKYQGDITAFNQNGLRMESMKWSSELFPGLSGITCHGNKILVTTFSANCVHEYDKRDKKWNTRAVEQLQGPGHWGICMVTDKMALAERNSDKAGVISIHSEEFELILHIDGMFTAVAASPDDCPFDRVNHSVKKYSIKGICLQSFKTNSKMVLGMYAQDDKIYLSIAEVILSRCFLRLDRS